jgi:hypothetical protein
VKLCRSCICCRRPSSLVLEVTRFTSRFIQQRVLVLVLFDRFACVWSRPSLKFSDPGPNSVFVCVMSAVVSGFACDYSE